MGYEFWKKAQLSAGACKRNEALATHEFDHNAGAHPSILQQGPRTKPQVTMFRSVQPDLRSVLSGNA